MKKLDVYNALVEYAKDVEKRVNELYGDGEYNISTLIGFIERDGGVSFPSTWVANYIFNEL